MRKYGPLQFKIPAVDVLKQFQASFCARSSLQKLQSFDPFERPLLGPLEIYLLCARVKLASAF